MPRNPTVPEKVSDWLMAYNAIRDELTQPGFREIANLATPDQGAAAIALGVQMSKIVFANDRAAAVVAGMLTQSGVSRPQFDVIDGGGED